MEQINNLTEGSIFKKLLTIAIPVLMTSIAQMAYNLTDLFWVGRVDNIGLGESEAISAVGSAGYIVWFALGLAVIARIGTSVKVSHAVGEKKSHDLAQFASTGITLELVMGVVFSIIVFVFRGPILGIFQIQSPIALEYAKSYLGIVGGMLFFQFVTTGFAAVNEGLGKTKRNFGVLLVGLVMNMILDPLMILGFRWGVSGAAIATIASQATTMFVFIFVHYSSEGKLFHLGKKDFSLKKGLTILKVGVPTGLQSMLFTTFSIIIARMVFAYGEDVVTAQRVGVQIEQFTWMIAGGFQAALTVFIGQNFGARQFQRIKRGVLTLSAILLPYAFLVALALYFVPEFLISLFIDKPISIAYGTAYLKIISFAQLFMMLEAIGAAFFSGIGRTIVPSVSGILFNGMRIPLAIYLSGLWAQDGIWWTLNISDIFKGATMLFGSLILFWMISRQKGLFKPKELVDVLENQAT